MKLIRLTAEAYVNPDDVSSVALSDYGESVIVFMKDGRRFEVMPNYGESRYQALDRITAVLQSIPQPIDMKEVCQAVYEEMDRIRRERGSTE